ncbi:MAG: alanine racemase [Methylococcales symbiont of Hymedesmia sp. n. MRB-2018]|nr:MAG: alanine racemase [Methylococcales symbiont of Hymedesmia sp. n. MRB-2018]KAF3983949.1 MAG: alanine racemase [Methylococcales symbiont of Hymedesmia sp. n. MRB-2018]
MSAITYAVIDTTAIKHNLSVVTRYAPASKVMAVIKANGYGHGLVTVAKALESVDALAVARPDEGIQLRQAGFSQRITVLAGFVCEQELNDLIKYDLEAVIHSQHQLEIIENQKGKGKISIWLKLNVGMNRLGFNIKSYHAAYQRLWQCLSVNKPFALMTHLSNANDSNKEITLKQISTFKEIVNTLDGEQSIANSAAILACPDSLADWVRPGIMLYGVSPFAGDKKSELKPVMSLHSKLIAIKHINLGEPVGYSGTWISKESTKLGVVAIGYGDGYPRHARNGTPVLVNGIRVPLVGRVSMDMITIDLTELAQVKVGDPVTLWGQGLLVEEIARYADTIPYTLICGITQRVDIRII